MQKWRCVPCDYVYDPKKGDPKNGIAPGTAFEDLPEDWVCPDCSAGKDMFEKVELKSRIMAIPGNLLRTAMTAMPHTDLQQALSTALPLDIPFWPQLPNYSQHRRHVRVSLQAFFGDLPHRLCPSTLKRRSA